MSSALSYNVLSLKELNRYRDIKAAFGVSRTFVYCGMKDGHFPRPVRIGKKAVAWRRDDLIAWSKSLAAA